jgi:putative tricarboxylic transport membrane protein
VLGGHTDVAIGTVSVLAPQLASGKLRAFAVSAPKRLSGTLSAIPTWKEQGLNLVEGNWRGVVGPKNLGDAEVAYWSGKLAEAVKTGEWADNLKRNHWDADFVTGAEAKRFLDTHYEELRSTLANLRVAK